MSGHLANDPFMSHSTVQPRPGGPPKGPVSQSNAQAGRPASGPMRSPPQSYGSTARPASGPGSAGYAGLGPARVLGEPAAYNPQKRKAVPRNVTRLLLVQPILFFFVCACVAAFSWVLLPQVAGSLVVAVSLFGIVQAFGHQDLQTFAVALVGLAVCSGSVTGIFASDAYIGPYYAALHGREYVNVLASSAGSEYADAGRLHFAETSNVDASRSVGFTDGRTYCVAPVVDSGSTMSRKIGFWAIGLDCCSHRGDFECGDAGNSDARGGLRAPPDGYFRVTHDNFMRAVNMSLAINDLTSDPDAVLVTWTADPGAAQESQVLRGISVVLLGTAIFALVTLGSFVFTSTCLPNVGP